MITTLGRPAKILLAVGLLAIVVLQLLPFYVSITTSLKERTDLSSTWLPPLDGVFFGNFLSAITDGNILQSILNSAIITGVSTILVCFLGAMAAYPLARRLSKMNKVVGAVILALIMIPPLSILVPLYTMLTQMQAVNTYWGIIAVMVSTQLPLSIFFYTAFMRSLPISVEEAATVDGASTFQTFFLVVLPVLKPVTATVAILTGVSTWNEYALSSFILTDPAIRTIAPSIASFFSAQSSNLGAASAASLLAVLPVLLAYLFLQRYFIKGMVAGSEK